MDELTHVDMIENHTFDEIRLGDSAQLSRTLQPQDIQLFASMSGDVNPAHVDPEYARSTQFHGIIAHGMWGAALISTVIGTEFPGPGSIYMGQSLRFVRPVHIGDTITVRVSVSEIDAKNHHITLDCRCRNQAGEDVITGSALVLAPTDKVCRPRVSTMQVRLSDKTLRYHQLMAMTQNLPPITVALVHPCTEAAIHSAIEARDLGLITPVLIGPIEQIHAVARAAQIDLLALHILPAVDGPDAARLAVAMAHEGQVQAIMQGSLPCSDLLAALGKSADGVSGGGPCLSHVHVLDVPSYPRPLLVTDAAVHFDPDLDTKRHIVCNAIALAHALGIAAPKVAILAAVEVVDPGMRSTVDAAALCKMAERGQITGGVLDGPLAFDTAISAQAALDKGIHSPVAGQADILVAPNLEAGNMIAKQLRYLADAQSAGLLVGAAVPVILSSVGDSDMSSVASCALAVLMAQRATPSVR